MLCAIVLFWPAPYAARAVLLTRLHRSAENFGWRVPCCALCSADYYFDSYSHFGIHEVGGGWCRVVCSLSVRTLLPVLARVQSTRHANEKYFACEEYVVAAVVC